MFVCFFQEKGRVNGCLKEVRQELIPDRKRRWMDTLWLLERKSIVSKCSEERKGRIDIKRESDAGCGRRRKWRHKDAKVLVEMGKGDEESERERREKKKEKSSQRK